ncbi:hypothetical protein [uncultured Thermanaerothrix sp.]|uniref:hypothetical protein n=1 Tax=uncultured Thermanaerothrix sp. TaxID=1195149 RepID=UPI0026324C58|nr:hypothetical protein [uncultured Thermanaerothrix sp.]
MAKRLFPIWQVIALRLPFGNLGPLLLWTDKRGRKVFMARRGPKPPPSVSQLRHWFEMAAVAAAWWNLAEEERDYWRQAAKRCHLRTTGYGLWLAACLDPQPTWLDTIQHHCPDIPLQPIDCRIPLDWKLK